MYVVENKMSYFEKQLYFRKLHEQTTSTSNQPLYAPRSQQIQQHNAIAAISQRIQKPIMNPNFKSSRHKNQVNEPQGPTPHTKNIATTHQPQPTRPSSQPDVPAQRSVRPAQPILPITPGQPSSHRAQLAHKLKPLNCLKTTSYYIN